MSAADLTTAPAVPNARYTIPAIVFHWVIAALILYNLYLGWQYTQVEGYARFTLMQLHKSVGLTVLVLSVLRLVWRLIHKHPPYPDTMKPWEKLAAQTVHWAFYGIMIGMPLTGWILVSVSEFKLPTLLYQTVPWPHLPVFTGLAGDQRSGVEDAAELIHYYLAWSTAGLFLLHVGAVIKHQFIAKDGVLYRMAPFLKPRRP